jgi:hypothetical protein
VALVPVPESQTESAMKKIILTIITALPLTTTLGCDSEENIDPVWGSWEAEANGCNARTKFEIDDDYKGDGRYVTSDCTVCDVNLDIENRGDGDYEIEVNPVDCQGTLDLDCELDDTELECEDEVGNKIDFEQD